MIKFRTEKAYGNGGHSPAEILAYETINLGNTWILEDFRRELDDLLSGETKRDIDWWLAAKEKGIVKSNDEDVDYSPYLPMFEGVIKALEEKKGVKINYLLWLTDLDNLLELYYDEPLDYLNDIDAYKAGVEIINFEGDGNLYAYQEKPKSLSKDAIKEILDHHKGLYKVFVYPGIGYSLQTIYFDHYNIKLSEIANVCSETNLGCLYNCSSLSSEETKEFEEDDRYAFVDMSEYKKDNVYLLIENLKIDEDAELVA